MAQPRQLALTQGVETRVLWPAAIQAVVAAPFTASRRG